MLTMRTLEVSDMNLLDAGITALMGYAVVFVGLVLLMAVVTLLGQAMMAGRKEKQAEAPAAPPPRRFCRREQRPAPTTRTFPKPCRHLPLPAGLPFCPRGAGHKPKFAQLREGFWLTMPRRMFILY